MPLHCFDNIVWKGIQPTELTFKLSTEGPLQGLQPNFNSRKNERLNQKCYVQNRKMMQLLPQPRGSAQLIQYIDNSAIQELHGCLVPGRECGPYKRQCHYPQGLLLGRSGT